MNAENVARLASKDRAMAYWKDQNNFPVQRKSMLNNILAGIFSAKLFYTFTK